MSPRVCLGLLVLLVIGVLGDSSGSAPPASPAKDQPAAPAKDTRLPPHAIPVSPQKPIPLKLKQTRDETRRLRQEHRVDLEERRAMYRQRFAREDGCIPMPVNPDDPPLPTMPNSFSTKLEIALQEDDVRTVLYGKEMYDSATLRGVNEYELAEGLVVGRPTVLAELIHYNIPWDEALFIVTNAGCAITGMDDCYTGKRCTAGTISDMSAELQELFGILDVTGDGASFMGAAGLLLFGPQFNYSTAPQAMPCRGMDCHVYETCLNHPEEQASLLYTYYWSTPEWNVMNNGQQVPVAVDIYGTGKFEGHTTREVMMRFDFFDFRREWVPSREVLEPPADVYCYGRVSHKAPPHEVVYFNYKAEAIASFDFLIPDGENQTSVVRLRGMFPQQEHYDWNTKIYRFDYVPLFVYGDERRFENLTQQLYEFSQGLTYGMKPRLSQCNVRRIENFTSWGTVEVGEDGSVFMLSPWNYEGLSEPMQYNGKHWVRGMESDVWVGIKPNQALGINETYAWYFAAPLTNEVLGRRDVPVIPTFDKVPVMQEKYITAVGGLPHSVTNIFGYNAEVPTTHTHDISICYQANQMRHFQFDLPANTLNKTMYLRENLKYATMEALAETGKVSPLRINKVELITKKNQPVQVKFTLLERPDYITEAPMQNTENTMAKAEQEIHYAIDHSQLVILVKYGTRPDPVNDHTKQLVIATVVAMPNTMREITRDDGHTHGTTKYTGYSPGAMGGLAVGMIILGGLLGFGGMLFYSNRQ